MPASMRSRLSGRLFSWERKMTRGMLFDFVRKRWGIEPDRPFADYPEAEVLRHQDTGKWFAIVMPVKAEKFGLPVQERNAELEVVNLKCQPPLVTLLLEKEGVFPAYHMNRKHWVSIPLGGTFPEEEILELVELSFRLTEKGRKRKKTAED